MRLSRHLSLLVLAAIPATSAVGQTPYKQPPRDVVAILDAPPPPLTLVSPTRDAMLLVEIRPYPSIELVAAPVLRLAGLRINPQTGCSQRTTQYAGITIKPLDNGPARRLALPAGARSTHRAGPTTARRSRSSATWRMGSSSGLPTRPPAR